MRILLPPRRNMLTTPQICFLAHCIDMKKCLTIFHSIQKVLKTQ